MGQVKLFRGDVGRLLVLDRGLVKVFRDSAVFDPEFTEALEN